MKRNRLNLIVDALTLLVLLAVVWTGLVLKFVLPQGSPKMGWTLMGLGRHDWGEVHFWITVSMGVLLLVHLALHWSWTCTTLAQLLLRRKPGEPRMPAWQRNLLGASVLVILVSVMAIAVNEARVVAQSGPDADATSASGRQPRPRLERAERPASEDEGETEGAQRRRRGDR